LSLSRFRLKPVWRDEFRDKYFELAGRFLLYSFILSIAFNSYLVIYLGSERFSYVVVEDYSRVDGSFNPSSLSPEQFALVSSLRVVDKEYLDDVRKFENYISWISITALLGWCVTSPSFMRGWSRYVLRWREE